MSQQSPILPSKKHKITSLLQHSQSNSSQIHSLPLSISIFTRLIEFFHHSISHFYFLELINAIYIQSKSIYLPFSSFNSVLNISKKKNCSKCNYIDYYIERNRISLCVPSFDIVLFPVGFLFLIFEHMDFQCRSAIAHLHSRRRHRKNRQLMSFRDSYCLPHARTTTARLIRTSRVDRRTYFGTEHCKCRIGLLTHTCITAILIFKKHRTMLHPLQFIK